MKVGEILRNKYKVEQLTAQGGMGDVYLVSELKNPRKFWALKQIRWEDSEPELATQLFAQFQKEAALLKSLRHPMIPAIKEYFSQTDSHFLIREFIPGHTLQELMQEQLLPFGEKQVVEWGIKLCELLAYLHSRLPAVYVHDLRPANLILTPAKKLKLVDLGIARSGETPPWEFSLLPLGAPGFTAPELPEGAASSPQTDIFSLGVCLFVLLTKKEPHQISDSLAGIPYLKEKLKNILLKATGRLPQNRYFNALMLKSELVQISGQL